ncbi:MAG: hypothetical protein A2X80_08630 [Geobacteraceae bacterium GWB2_52_12]|nr:MAG: hypothetical protein A2X80_08630 [Geobacteraceae bacterium GWB2_52_12]
MEPVQSERHVSTLIPGRIVGIYVAVSGLWIFFSDYLLELLVQDRQQMAQLAMLKGWFFILVTALLLFYLISRYGASLRELNSDLQRQIQERRAVQEALFESESRFRTMMEQVHMCAVMLDRQGMITFCNDFLINLSGWSREEIIGKSWFETFIPETIRDKVTDLFFQGISTGELTIHYENEILTRNGVRLIVWDNTFLQNADGTVAGCASLGIDVTDHRKLEAQLLQSQKMESVGTLAGGIAHDFNNILTVIMSCSTMLRNKINDHERAMQLIEQIDRAAHRAATLTGSLLAFSRKQTIAPRQIDLNQVVAGMQEFLERIIGEDVVLTTALAPDKIPVLADSGQLEQVVMNLVSNARDAMPGGGTVTIQTDQVHFDAHLLCDGSVVSGFFGLLKVTDNGVGISGNDRERVFEPFFTTKEVGKGTGLGLSMAYGIIRQHNGWIDLESDVGRGSSFLVYLPVVGQSEEVVVPKREEQVPGGDGTILLVEDDEQVLQINREILETAGYQVVAVNGGEEALESYSRLKDVIALAIIDVVMPGMTGRQLYDELMLINPRLRVLFTSGYTADILDRQKLPPGCAFSPKPHTSQELLQLVHEMIHRE